MTQAPTCQFVVPTDLRDPPSELAGVTPLRLEEYTLYSRLELCARLREAMPDTSVELIPSRHRAYNLIALEVARAREKL